MNQVSKKFLRYQPGFQEQAFHCKSDLAILGGAAGSGKTYLVLLDIMKNVHDKNYRAGVFRKNRHNILCAGGLWEGLLQMARSCGISVHTNRHELKMTFPSGATVSFSHSHTTLSGLKEYLRGTQFSVIYIDEGEDFDYQGFRYAFSRLRSESKVKPYMRITTNPNQGWIKSFLQPFLDEDDYPIKEECGKLKYLTYINDEPVLRDTKEEFEQEFDLSEKELSSLITFTFIPGSLEDNQIMLQNNPNYASNLQQLPPSERDRLLYGWWGEIASSGLFKETDFRIYTKLPETIDRMFIVGDTALKAGPNNDFTVFTSWVTSGKNLYLCDMERGKWNYQSMRSKLIDFIQNNPGVDTVYLEDCNTGSVLLHDLISESLVRDIVKFRSISRAQGRLSKGKRAQEARSFLNVIDVFLPLENERMRKQFFLKEICSFSLEMDHANDDIADTFFDAAHILAAPIRRQLKINEKEQKKYEVKKLENLGGRSVVHG